MLDYHFLLQSELCCNKVMLYSFWYVTLVAHFLFLEILIHYSA